MLLYASILFFVVPPQNVQTNPQNKMAVSALSSTGSCGDNVTYTFDSSTGTLTISGTGVMTNYSYSPSSRRSPFYENSEIYSITIGSGVTSIGDDAFYNCSSLTSITIPDGVTSIGDNAFYGCSGLTSITIPDGVTSIGNYVFYGCSALTSITIPDSVKSINNNAFYGCSGLTSITIPDSVTYIGNNAFYGCSGLTSITIPGSVKSINNNAFYDCSGLTSITIPNGVTSIGDFAFYGCSGLTSITIPASVTSIGNYAFYGCSGLTSIVVASGNTKYNSSNNCNAIIETSTNTLILGCKNTTIPDSVTSIGDDAFYDCSGLTSITIPDSVTSIGSAAFRDCSGLTSIAIPDGVTSIGSAAFRDCSGLTSIAIPDGVTSIGNYVFSGCSSLTSIVVASGNTKYDSRDNCNAIIETSTNTLIVGCKNTIIPSGVTSIGNAAFYDCSGLTSITIPNGVTSIGDFAFAGCSGLTSITIPASVTSIGYNVFYYSGLTSIVVASGNTKYDSRNNCNAIIETSTNTLIVGCKSTIIPSGVTSIGDFAFAGCSGLTSITIPASVTSINYAAFDGCDNLTIIGSGDTTKTAYTYAQSNSIDYATAWVKKDSSTHTRTFYGFRSDSSADAVTQTENHNFGDDDICSVCGALNLLTITINVTTNVPRNFVIYILDSNNQPTRQFVATNGTPIEFAVAKSSTFTVQVYETLYMSATIDGEKLLKKTYSNVSNDTTISVDISGVMNVNNWVMI